MSQAEVHQTLNCSCLIDNRTRIKRRGLFEEYLAEQASIICGATEAFVLLPGGLFLAPWLVRHYVPKIAQDQLKKQAVVGDVHINPYTFTVEANDFRMEESDGQPIMGFKRLFVDFELKSLFKWAWTFPQVNLEGPHVNAVIANDGTLNLAGLAPPTEAPPQPPEKDKTPSRLIMEEITIDEGQSTSPTTASPSPPRSR